MCRSLLNVAKLRHTQLELDFLPQYREFNFGEVRRFRVGKDLVAFIPGPSANNLKYFAKVDTSNFVAKVDTSNCVNS